MRRAYFATLAAAGLLLSVVTITVYGVQAECGGLPATITGTPGDDVIVGTPGNDVIDAGPGDDTVDAMQGNDVVCGYSGDDEIQGNQGSDVIFGGNGDDVIDAGVFGFVVPGPEVPLSVNVVYGEDGNDILFAADFGNDTLVGGNQDDDLFSFQGPGSLHGENGDDQLIGGILDDKLFGGPGGDHLDGGTQVLADILDGANGTDVCVNGEVTVFCEPTTP